MSSYAMEKIIKLIILSKQKKGLNSLESTRQTHE